MKQGDVSELLSLVDAELIFGEASNKIPVRVDAAKGVPPPSLLEIKAHGCAAGRCPTEIRVPEVAGFGPLGNPQQQAQQQAQGEHH